MTIYKVNLFSIKKVPLNIFDLPLGGDRILIIYLFPI
nr:MAG TPA: hypothetical protein [Bacteriophage sp.]